VPRLSARYGYLVSLCAVIVFAAGCGGGSVETSVDAVAPAVPSPATVLGYPPMTTGPAAGVGERAPDTNIRPQAQSTATVPKPATASLPAVPAVDDVGEKLAQNNNTRDGQLGSLCWARWEVARHLLIGLTQPGQADLAARRLEEALGSAEATVDLVSSDLSPEVLPFAHRLRLNVGEARAELVRTQGQPAKSRVAAVATKFDFDGYPGAKEYMSQAAQHPACANP
jgi:hypothetical protein